MSSIGQIVADIRRERKLQSKFVAITAGIESSRYSRIETEKRDPTDQELLAIAKAMQIDVTEIIGKWQTKLTSAMLERKTLPPRQSTQPRSP